MLITLALLDMTSVFDTVDYSNLLQRYQRPYGTSCNVLAWFTSYLAARAQSVLFWKKSPSCHVPLGVPQGFVLGPLLFILYVGQRRCSTVPYLSSRQHCHMCLSHLDRHRKIASPVHGGKSFGNESSKDWHLMVFHMSSTIQFTTYTS